MGIVLRLAWRNLWRHKRRTWVTASAIAFVTVLMVFLITLQLGSYDLMVDSSLRIYTAHMQVQREGFIDKPQIRNTVPDAVALAGRLRADPALRGVSIAARAQAFALVSSEKRSYGVQVVGVEPQFEPAVSTIPRLVKSGRFLSGPDAQEAVVGAPLAQNLNIKVGDELTLLGSAMDGSVAATIVPVVGIFESGMHDLDRALTELPLGTFQDLFGMNGGAHAIALLVPDLQQLPQLKQSVVHGALPYDAFLEAGLPVSLNTDDPGILMTSLPHELAAMYRARVERSAHRDSLAWLAARMIDARRSTFLTSRVPGGEVALALTASARSGAEAPVLFGTSNVLIQSVPVQSKRDSDRPRATEALVGLDRSSAPTPRSAHSLLPPASRLKRVDRFSEHYGLRSED